MKKVIFVVAILAFSTFVYAQDTYTSAKKTSANKTFIASIGIEPTIPVGNFSDFSSFGLGGSLQGEIKPGRRVGITASAGFIDYFGKTVNGVELDDFKYWPVLGGLKLYMSDKAYIHGQGGPGFGTNGLGTSFWYGAGIGFNLGRAMNAEFKYTGWKQNEVSTTGGTEGTPGTPGYTGTTGGTGTVGTAPTTGGTVTTSGTGGSYGGHYSTLSVRLAYNF
jgi:hypothetical protein